MKGHFSAFFRHLSGMLLLIGLGPSLWAQQDCDVYFSYRIRGIDLTEPDCPGDPFLLEAELIQLQGGQLPPPFITYTWSGPGGGFIGNPASFSRGGTYTLRVTTICQELTRSITVNVPNPPDAVITASTSPLCAGENLILSASNIPGYSYEWRGPNGYRSTSPNPLVSSNAQPQRSGVYTLTTTSPEGCPGPSGEETVVVHPQPVANPAELVACVDDPTLTPTFDLRNAEEIVDPDNQGQVLWYFDPVDPNALISDPSAYSPSEDEVYAEIQSDEGCISERVVVSLDTAADIQTELIIRGSPNCQDSLAGTLQIAVQGGTPPFTYAWNQAALGDQNTAEQLGPGLYEVTVTDVNGCQESWEWEFPDPGNITLNCFLFEPVQEVGAATGSVILFHPDLYAPGMIRWTGPVGGDRPTHTGNADTLTGLPAGSYTFTLEDTTGCTASCTLDIPGPDCSDLLLTAQSGNPLCAGDSSGQIFLFIEGTVGDFSIDWSNDALDGVQNPSGLTSGNYSVTVTDERGCTDSLIVSLQDPEPVDISCLPVSFPSTPNSLDGALRIDLMAGSGLTFLEVFGPISQIDTFTQDTSFILNDLPAGDYELVVSNFNDCIARCTILLQPLDCSDFAVDVMVVSPDCAEAATGRITTQVSGGHPPYSYFWGPNQLAGTDQLSNIPAGEYVLNVVDSLGCRQTISISVPDPPPLRLSCSLANPVSTVGGSDGRITYEIGGGTPPYQITWTGPVTGSRVAPTSGIGLLEDLPAGNYLLRVIDAQDCQNSCTIRVPGPDCDLLSVRAIAEPVQCPDDRTGVVRTQVAGGVPPYRYSWGVTGVPNTPTLTDLPVGLYPVTVTDAQGCSAQAAAQIVASVEVPTLSVGPLPAICRNACLNIPLTLTGTPPFQVEYRILSDAGVLDTGLLESVTNNPVLSICPEEWDISTGSLRLEWIALRDAFCSGPVFGESLIPIQSPARHFIDTLLCLDQSITINGRTYDRNNPFGTEILRGGAANGCDSIIEVTLRFRTPPEVVQLRTPCHIETGTYRIVLEMVGSGPFLTNGVAGTWSGRTWTSEDLTQPTPFSIRVVDAMGCSRDINITPPDCSRSANCPVSAPDILAVQSDGCTGDTIVVALSDTSALPEGFVREIVLHNGSPNELGDILRFSRTNELLYGPPLNVGVSYYVAVIVGPEQDGRVDLASPCVDLTLGPEIRFRAGPQQPTFIQGQDTLCAGETLLLFAEEQADVRYIWTRPSGQKDTTDTRLLRINQVSEVDAGPYYVAVTNGDCVSPRFGPQFFEITPFPEVDAGADQAVCRSDSLVLQATPAGGLWESLSSEPLLLFPQDTQTLVDNLQPGISRFVWRVTDRRCSQSDTVAITYLPQPVLNDDNWVLNETSDRITFDAFRNDQLPGYALADSTVFVVAQPEAGLVRYFAEDRVFDFTYERSGLEEVSFAYAVCHPVCGSCDTANVRIVLPDVFLIVPEGITPNNDGRNDFLRIENIEAYPENEVVIVNRWGQTVYRRANYTNLDPWDGTHNGNPLPQGAYYLVVRVTGRSTVVKQTIHLINQEDP